MTDFAPPVPPPPPPPPGPAIAATSATATAAPPSSAPSFSAVVVMAVVAAALGWGVWFLLEDTLAEADPANGVPWVPAATMATAGLLWAAWSPGSARAARLATATAAGAVTGAAGAFALGGAELHQEAVETGAIEIGRIAVWAAVGAVAWAVTLGAAATPERRRSTVIGAAAGGAASGGVMGALAGQWIGGDPARVTPTDFWWSLPLELADVGVRVVPVLVVGVVVPMLCAHPVRDVPRTLGRAAAVLAVLVGASVAFVGTDDAISADTGPTTDGGPRPNVATPATVDHPRTDAPVGAPVPMPPADTPIAATTTSPVAPTAPADPADAAFPYDAGFDVAIAYDSTVVNTSGETATVQIAFGPPTVADSALPVSTGALVCPLGPRDVVIPFMVVVGASGLDTATSLRVAFGQGGVVGADPGAHPMTVQWNEAGGRMCRPATSIATDPASAGTVWATLQAGQRQSGTGYIVVQDYFDAAGTAVAQPSAATGVSVVVDDERTTGTFQLTGGDLVTVNDPEFGTYSGVALG